jgi:hypothetical protein
VNILGDQTVWIIPPDDADLDTADNRRLLQNILSFITPVDRR